MEVFFVRAITNGKWGIYAGGQNLDTMDLEENARTGASIANFNVSSIKMRVWQAFRDIHRERGLLF